MWQILYVHGRHQRALGDTDSTDKNIKNPCKPGPSVYCPLQYLKEPKHKEKLVYLVTFVDEVSRLNPGGFLIDSKNFFHHPNDLAQGGVGAHGLQNMGHGVFSALAGDA